MKHNNQNQPQGTGYPQQGGYGSEGNPRANPPQGYPVQQGYPQYQSYQQPQGYQQSLNYQQPAGNQGARNYQTPQVTGSQPAVNPQDPSSAFTGQGSYSQNGYQQQPFGQPQNSGYNDGFAQQNGFQQTGVPGYNFQGSQPSTGSYIPQTPYSQGYTSPGYQAPGGYYTQGYSPYTQMGRTPQMPLYPQQDMSGQVPLNGGGYVPQPVPVRKKPFVMTDTYLLIFSAVLLTLFALGMFVPGFGIVKWIFLIIAAGSTALLWIRPLVEKNKRLCFTIVFGLLMIVTLTRFITGGSVAKTSDAQQANGSAAVANNSAQGGTESGTSSVLSITSTPSVTNTPEPDEDGEVIQRLKTFFYYWSANRQDDMLTLCSPTWASKVEDPQKALFGLIGTRTPQDCEEESISGTSYDTMRTVTITSTIDRNNGKPAVRYRMSVSMVKENDGLWYVDPQSLQSFENADTPDPSVTDTPAPTATPAIDANTILYYNPSGGEYYHLDQNCRRIHERYLPLKGSFKYSELNKEPYNKLKPCAICGAPSPGQ